MILAKMIAFVAVKCNYPLTPALFTLRLFWHGEHHATNNDSIRVSFFMIYFLFFNFIIYLTQLIIYIRFSIGYRT